MGPTYEKRQVLDEHEANRQLKYTEYRAHSCSGSQCGQPVKTAFPVGVDGPIQLGPILIAKVDLSTRHPFLARAASSGHYARALESELVPGHGQEYVPPDGETDRSSALESRSTSSARRRNQASGRNRHSHW